MGWLEETMESSAAKSGISGSVELTAVGCPFFNRCPLAMPGTCDKEAPPDRVGDKGHVISCHVDIGQLQTAS